MDFKRPLQMMLPSAAASKLNNVQLFDYLNREQSGRLSMLGFEARDLGCANAFLGCPFTRPGSNEAVAIVPYAHYRTTGWMKKDRVRLQR